jgi:hypothetical protein
MVITAGTSASYYKCGDYKKRRTCSNSLGVEEELARTRIFSALQEKFSNPEALDYRASATALRDLHAQARTEKAAIAALEARGASPIALPTPAEVAERALGLKRLFEGNPIEVREALRRYFVDGRIVVTPVAQGY